MYISIYHNICLHTEFYLIFIGFLMDFKLIFYIKSPWGPSAFTTDQLSRLISFRATPLGFGFGRFLLLLLCPDI